MNQDDQTQLLNDGWTLEKRRHEPCALCGHPDDSGSYPIVRGGKVYCGKCWRGPARVWIPNN